MRDPLNPTQEEIDEAMRREMADKYGAGVSPFSAAPEPHPLPAKLLPVDPFDFDLMPKKLQSWVRDVAERMQCPPDYVGVSTMTAAGSLVGRKVALRPKANDDFIIVGNMWSCAIGRPGVKKSPAMRAALEPSRRLEALAEQEFKRKQAKYAIEAEGLKIRADVQRAAAKKLVHKDPKADIEALLELGSEDAEPEPMRARYIANDTSVESLGELLKQNPNGLLVFRDELLSLLDSLDQEEHASQKRLLSIRLERRCEKRKRNPSGCQPPK
jgi:putative DNA primase/helicase